MSEKRITIKKLSKRTSGKTDWKKQVGKTGFRA